MARLMIGDGVPETKYTEQLRTMKKLPAKAQGDFGSAMTSAGYYAKKIGQTMFVYRGNSYGHRVWRVSYKPSDYLNWINNDGSELFSVTPELDVTRHQLIRGDTVSERNEVMYRGWRIEKSEGSRHLGYTLPGKHYGSGKGKKSVDFYLYSPEEPDRAAKTVSTLRAAKQYIDNYIGDPSDEILKERRQNMRFPKIDDVAAELRKINKYDVDDDDGIDVRLQVYPDGDWAVRSGSSDYDQDHRGYWGASSVPGSNRRFDSKAVARDLISQAKEMDGEVDETRTVKSSVRTPGKRSGTEIQIPIMPIWEQIDGDLDISGYGGTLARSENGDSIELLKIQPVREYIGDEEAKEVGHPFWTREAYYSLDDLSLDSDDVRQALGYIGMDMAEFREDFTPTQRALTIASALLDYGSGVDEGPAGWSEDIYRDAEVKTDHGKTTLGELLSDEDDEFRREVLGEDNDEEDEDEDDEDEDEDE